MSPLPLPYRSPSPPPPAESARPEGAHAVDATPTTDSVTVGGSGSVVAVPTQASLSLGVDSRGDTAKAALAANAREMRKVIDAVEAAGGP